MPLQKRGQWWYGDSQDDIRAEMLRYSEDVGCPPHQFADAVCHCGERTFRLSMDYDAGVAIRNCVTCHDDHFIGDSEEHVEKAMLKEHDCFCGEDSFEITVGGLSQGKHRGRAVDLRRLPLSDVRVDRSLWRLGNRI